MSDVEIKNTRLIPSASFRYIDNGVLLTIVDSASGQVAEERVFEDLVSAFTSYEKVVKEAVEHIFKLEQEIEKKKSE